MTTETLASDLMDQMRDFKFEDGDESKKREHCPNCMRPMNVCWCAYLPRQPLCVQTQLVILQHKYEEKRRLKTAPMLKRGLSGESCVIYKGSRFPLEKFSLLKAACENRRALLLYPSADAEDLNKLVAASAHKQPFTLIVLDGTWPQAKGIYWKNPWLRTIQQVKISHNVISKYVIRTQPRDEFLSTLESAAVALGILEGRPDIVELMVRPLEAMCDFQLQHGAVVHQSKQYLVENGLYKKQEVKPWDKVGRSRPRYRPKKTKTNVSAANEHVYSKPASAEDRTDQTVSTGDRIDQTVSAGEHTDQTVSAVDRTDRTVSAGDRTDRTVSAGDRTGQTVPAGDRTDQTVSTEDRTDQTVSAGDRTDQTVSAVDRTDQTVSTEDRTDQTVSAGDRTDEAVSAGDRTDETVSVEYCADSATSTIDHI